jgi:hypothetical protein
MLTSMNYLSPLGGVRDIEYLAKQSALTSLEYLYLWPPGVLRDIENRSPTRSRRSSARSQAGPPGTYGATQPRLHPARAAP